MGDFNYRTSDWEAFHSDDKIEMESVENIIDNGLIQNVGLPTGSRGLDNPNVVDLVFTNEENSINEIEYNSPLRKRII